MATPERTPSRALEQILVEAKQNIQHETLPKDSCDLLRSFIERALTDVERMVTSIKMKAQTEAEDEAVKIIDEAKQGADEIRRRTEQVAQKEAEDILSALIKKDDITEVEAKQKAQLYLLKAREEIEKEVREEYKQAHSRLLRSLLGKSRVATPPLETSAFTQIDIEPNTARKEKAAKVAVKEEVKRRAEKTDKAKEVPKAAEKTDKAKEVPKAAKNTDRTMEDQKQAEKAQKTKKAQKPTSKETKLTAKDSSVKVDTEKTAQHENKVTISKAPEEIMQEFQAQQIPKEKPKKRETVHAPSKPDKKVLYEGEVELAVSIPVDPAGLSKLYHHLQMIPEIKILYTKGSWDQGTAITITLDKPLPLIEIMSKIPNIEITPVVPQMDYSGKGTSNALLRGDKKRPSRIDIRIKKRKSKSKGNL